MSHWTARACRKMLLERQSNVDSHIGRLLDAELPWSQEQSTLRGPRSQKKLKTLALIPVLQRNQSAISDVTMPRWLCPAV